MVTDGEFGLIERREKQGAVVEVLDQVKSCGQNACIAFGSERLKFIEGELEW